MRYAASQEASPPGSGGERTNPRRRGGLAVAGLEAMPAIEIAAYSLILWHSTQAPAWIRRVRWGIV